MTCNISEEQLWSWIDQGAEELEAHLAICPQCRARAEEIRSGIQAVADGSTVLTIPLSQVLPSAAPTAEASTCKMSARASIEATAQAAMKPVAQTTKSESFWCVFMMRLLK